MLLGCCALMATASACGKSEPESAGKDGKTAGGEQALPALPSDPLALIPSGASVVVTADLNALRASPHFAMLKRWAMEQSCSTVPADWLLDRSTRLVAAGFESVAGQMSGLLIIAGPNVAGDTVRLLQERSRMTGQAVPDVQEQPRGRFFYAESKGVAAARIGAGLIAVGDGPNVVAALEVADGKHAAWPNADAAATALVAEGWLARHNVGLIGRISEQGARRMQRTLGRLGANSAAAGLDQGALTFALDVTSQLRASAAVELPDPAAADKAAADLRSSFGQLDLLLRLTGLPAALAHPDIRTEDKRLHLAIELTEGDVRDILERLDSVIPPGSGRCT